MQGGMIASAIDNVVGPLSYLMGKTALTTQLNVSFLQPVTPDVDTILVDATQEVTTGPNLFLIARVMNPSRDTVFAVGQAQFRSTSKAASRS